MDELVNLSRLQFAITAMYHFIFVPLTLGLSWILFMMEALYVITNKSIYKDLTKFWGKIFGINFAMGVTTGITLEFQFGTNWAYYSHYVGDVFGTPLAIEGLMAFFLKENGRSETKSNVHDLLIASTAISNGFAVLTSNADDFKNIPSLIVESPN